MVPYHSEFLIPLMQEERQRHAAKVREHNALRALCRQARTPKSLRFAAVVQKLTTWLPSGAERPQSAEICVPTPHG